MTYYKVVRNDLTGWQIGVKGKPNPDRVQYKIGEWAYPYHPELGGCYVATNLAFIRNTFIKKVINETRGSEYLFENGVRVFECEIGKVLSKKGNPIETDKVKLVRELTVYVKKNGAPKLVYPIKVRIND